MEPHQNNNQSELALDILSDAFGFTVEELKKFGDTTKLSTLYNMYVGKWGDTLEYETLHYEIEKSLGRELTPEEIANVVTIGDVIRILRKTSEKNPYNPATIGAPNTKGRLSLWRVLPAAFFLLLGLGFIGVIAMVIGLTFEGEEMNPPLSESWPKAIFWVVAGIVWISSAACFWSGRYRQAIYMAVAAFAIIAIDSFISPQ